MSKRLQVILDDAEAREIHRLARRQRMSLSEWVRQALRNARRQEPQTDQTKKIQVIRGAVRHSYPTADIGQMLSEIEQGYLKS
jgi:ribbon-helix-helix CopG family protein